MFQSNVLFEANKMHPKPGKTGSSSKITGSRCLCPKHTPNSTALAEGEGVTATCFGRPSGGGILNFLTLGRDGWKKLIHRVPSVEEATATCFGNFTLTNKIKKIYSKNAPNKLSTHNKNKTRRIAHGA